MESSLENYLPTHSFAEPAKETRGSALRRMLQAIVNEKPSDIDDDEEILNKPQNRALLA